MTARPLALGAALLAACASTPRPSPALERASVHRATGDEARAMGDPAAAAYAYARALAAARAADDRKGAADAGYRLGTALLAAGQPAEAAIQLQDAGAVALRSADEPLAARAMLALARARQESRAGDVREALEGALALAERANQPVLAALAQLGLGASGPEGEAERRYAAADRLAGADPAVAGPLALNRARLAERRGDLAAAGPLFLAAAAQYRDQEDPDSVGLYLALSGAARAADADAGGARAAADLHRRAADAAVFAGRTEQAVAELRRAADAHRRAGEAGDAARRDAEAKRLEAEGQVEKRAAAL
jgi:tetratricopeptide (TPR) repeat protein